MKSGRLTWYLQRYSAIYFITFLVYLEYTFILLACVHAYIGLWTVGTDYLTKRTLGFISSGLGASANTLRKIYEYIFILLGALIAALYILIIWF
ncbi:MAG: hypothetical protein EBW43_01870 [Proteobacteria bacterium]|nr:hypothetical protein [Pseudomonadota bacterium]